MKDIPIKARKALAEGKIQEANAILGDYYSFKGTVVEGRHLGRILGFPTANLKVNNEKPFFTVGLFRVYNIARHLRSVFFFFQRGLCRTIQDFALWIKT